MLSSLRKRFWVLHGNSAVRQLFTDCVRCSRFKGELGEQKMADLPECRVDSEHPPFYHTGVDYFGPYTIKDGRKQVKRWGVVFTCMASRAIHIEVATSLDTDSCLHALRRFISRRGYVCHLYTDNGTNFVGACRELQRTWDMGIEWHFNPPTASHFGGSWERMIRTIRKVLYGILSEHGHRLDPESLHTFLCGVESVINSRPITALSSDVSDPEPLTPNHILTGKTHIALSNINASQDADVYLCRRWRRVQQLAASFWKRWRSEFLTSLQGRQKWQDVRDNLKKGDIVMVKDEDAARTEWPLGVVVVTEADQQGRVRVVSLRSKGRIIRARFFGRFQSRIKTPIGQSRIKTPIGQSEDYNPD